MNKGVPAEHQPFWRRCLIYKAQSVSTAMTLKMIKEAEDLNDSEKRVLSYLCQFIRNMGINELCTFL